jgi:AraC family transcriptional regulator
MMYSPQEQRIYRLISLLETRTTDSLRLDDLARQACYSVHHFERVFYELIGQTPMDYLRRRRLLSACMRARFETTCITQIAMDSGYSSSASFAKAFRQYFGFSARDWRHGAWHNFMANNHQASLAIDAELIKNGINWFAGQEVYRKNISARIQVVTMPKMAYLYRCWHGGAPWNDLDAAFGKILNDAASLKLLNQSSKQVSVLREDHGLIRVDQTLFDFGLLISSQPELAKHNYPGFLYGELPAGIYASLTFQDQQPLYHWIHEDWLEKQQLYTLDAQRPYINITSTRDKPLQGQMLLPIRRR